MTRVLTGNEEMLKKLDPKAEINALKAKDDAVKAVKRKAAAELRARKAVMKARARQQQPKRTSDRARGAPPRYEPSFEDETFDSVRAARTQYLELPDRTRRPKKRKQSLPPLSEANRKALDTAKDWLEDFEGFLTTGEFAVSDANRRSVVKQATKMVSGAGVPHPRADAIFLENQPVGLGSDFLALIDEAQEFEDTHGEDYGHG